MTYELVFDPRAYREWEKLGETVRAQFKKKLADVLVQPRIEAADCMTFRIAIRSNSGRLATG